MAGEYTPEMIAMLEAQRAYFASDACLVERADESRELSPAECWAETVAVCADVEWMFSLMDPATRARAEEPEPLPGHVLATLEAMQRR